MIHNFKKYIEGLDFNPAIKACLLDLYKAEEDGKSDPAKVPSLAYYEIIVDKYFDIYKAGVLQNEA